MLTILLVEDDTKKAVDVIGVLSSFDEIARENIQHVTNLHAARQRLHTASYDLLLLDIVLPNFEDSEPLPDGGTKLLTEIRERPDRFRTPAHVVGITQYAEMHTTASKTFQEGALAVLLYERSSDIWERTLAAVVRHLLCARTAREEAASVREGIELAVVCALPIELQAVRALPWSWSAATRTLMSDPTAYFRGSFARNGDRFSVVAAAAPRMGMTAAAVLATKMITQFRPRVVVMTGIAAGVPGKVALGDVIIADPVWDYGSGKWVEDGDASRFEIAPHQVGLTPTLRTAFTLLSEDVLTLAAIRSRWQAEPPPHPLRVHVGPMASGAAVLADATALSQVIRQNRKTLGIEMEAYGVYVAADEAADPRPAVVAMKAVADFADPGKQDNHQRYCAYVSAAILQHAAERLL